MSRIGSIANILRCFNLALSGVVIWQVHAQYAPGEHRVFVLRDSHPLVGPSRYGQTPNTRRAKFCRNDEYYSRNSFVGRGSTATKKRNGRLASNRATHYFTSGHIVEGEGNE
jgi:hypothetical protein